MADYYPLLAKAVTGLPQPSSEETRRAIYERARSALLKQLRSITPPIAEADLTRESGALDDAVARLEAEIAAQAMLEAEIAAQAMARHSDGPETAAAQTEAVNKNDLAESANQTAANVNAPNAPGAQTGAQKSPPQKAKAGFSFRAAPPTHSSDLADTHDTSAAQTEAVDASASIFSEAESFEEDVSRLREAQRPTAPQPAAPEGRKYTYWIFAALILILVSAFAFTAYKLRGGSDSLAHFKTPAAEPAEPTAGKIMDRIGDESQANGKKKTQSPVKTNEPADDYASNPSVPQADPVPAQQQEAVPIASRSVLVIQSSEGDGKVKKYEGTVIWRLENVSQGAGQPVLPVIHADAEIPDAKLKMTLDIIKNTDPTFAPSHMIKIRYMIEPGSDIQGVKQVGAPMMRREESQNGDQLLGAATQITENYYLIGLKAGDPEAKNLDLLKNRGWLDVPLISTTGRMAKITLEKGMSGDRIFNEAITAWERQK